MSKKNFGLVATRKIVHELLSQTMKVGGAGYIITLCLRTPNLEFTFPLVNILQDIVLKILMVHN
jgi:hypothetical protein